MTIPEELSVGDRVRVHDLLFPYVLQTATILDRTVGADGATALGVVDRARTPRVVSPGRVHALDAPDDLATCAWCAHRRALARVQTHRLRLVREVEDGARGSSCASADDGRPRWMKAPAARAPARSR